MLDRFSKVIKKNCLKIWYYILKIKSLNKIKYKFVIGMFVYKYVYLHIYLP